MAGGRRWRLMPKAVSWFSGGCRSSGASPPDRPCRGIFRLGFPRGAAGESVGMPGTRRRSGCRDRNALCLCRSGMLPMPAFLAHPALFGEFASSITKGEAQNPPCCTRRQCVGNKHSQNWPDHRDWTPGPKSPRIPSRNALPGSCAARQPDLLSQRQEGCAGRLER